MVVQITARHLEAERTFWQCHRVAHCGGNDDWPDFLLNFPDCNTVFFFYQIADESMVLGNLRGDAAEFMIDINVTPNKHLSCFKIIAVLRDMNPSRTGRGFESFSKCSITNNFVETGDDALGPAPIQQIINRPGGVAIIFEWLSSEHLGAITTPPGYQTKGFHIFKRSSDSGSADAEFIGQLLFTGQIFSHPILACCNSLG